MFIYNKNKTKIIAELLSTQPEDLEQLMFKIGVLYNETQIKLQKHTNNPNQEILSKKEIDSIFTADESLKMQFYENFNTYASMFGVNETNKYMFIAELIAENGKNLKLKREYMNYRSDSLKKTFKIYRNNPSWAERDGRTSYHKAAKKRIANTAYANRMGNSDIKSGDGWKYRGGGFFQLTGKDNYKRITKTINQIFVENNINENYSSKYIAYNINTIKIGLLTAFGFWKLNNIYNCKDINCCTAKINKYTSSYKKREKIYKTLIG